MQTSTSVRSSTPAEASARARRRRGRSSARPPDSSTALDLGPQAAAITLLELVGAELVVRGRDARAEDSAAPVPDRARGRRARPPPSTPASEPAPPGVHDRDRAVGDERDRRAVGGEHDEGDVGLGGHGGVGVGPATTRRASTSTTRAPCTWRTQTHPARSARVVQLGARPARRFSATASRIVADVVEPRLAVSYGATETPPCRSVNADARTIDLERDVARARAAAYLQELGNVEVVVAEVEVVVGAAEGRLVVFEAERLRARVAGTPAVALALVAVEAGGDDGDADLVAERVVDDGAEDDVGVRVRGLADDLGRLVDLEQPEVGRARDVEQDPAGTFDARLEQRARDRGPGGVDRPAVARRVADAHQRGAGVAHDHPHVGEVGVDETGRRDEVGDALHALEQHLVAHLERVEHRRVLVGQLEQAGRSG